MRSRNSVCVAGLIVAAACAGPIRDVAERSPEVIIDDSAREIEYAKGGNSEEASYVLDVPYPARDFVHGVMQTLESIGWTASPKTIAGRAEADGEPIGWTIYIDETLKPSVEVRQWVGRWRKDDGSTITYTLMYYGESLDELKIFIRREGVS